MRNADMPAMPIFDDEARVCVVRDPNTKVCADACGLTKREHFAAMAMQGMVSRCDLCMSEANLAIKAVLQADALLKQLENNDERS